MTICNTYLEKIFHSSSYLLHNEKRLIHLKSLNLLITGQVLEVGAGIGDFTPFFIEHGCIITATDGRVECCEFLKQKMVNKAVVCHLDLENPLPNPTIDKEFDIICCYGTLYHLSNPFFALEFLSKRCKHMLLLETCVSMNECESINICSEDASDPSQSIHGFGCRPTRQWLVTTLKKFFKNVYFPVTQPDHVEFPDDWSISSLTSHSRAIFICSRELINNPLLTTILPTKQIKCR